MAWKLLTWVWLLVAVAMGGKPVKKNNAVALEESFFERWNSFKEMEAFMNQLAKRFKKTKMIKLSSIGKSAEHRSLTMMTLGTPSNPKYQLMLMGTMHGREWITSHAILYIAWRLLTSFEANDPAVTKLFEETQIYMLPVLNPDGYEFTRLPSEKNEQAREWRKNRRNLCSKCERGVHGIDLNRNWGVKGKSWGFGADRATSEVYQGKRPFSEPEIRAVRDWLLKGKRGEAINAFFDVHCCSGAILPPFYYSGEPEELQQRNLANCGAIAKAMRSVNNYKYKHRPREKEFSDSNTGIGVDWIFAEGKVQNVFIVETRGNRTKLLKYIFEVPEKEILPISRELEAGFWKMAEIFASPNNGMSSSPSDSVDGVDSGEDSEEGEDSEVSSESEQVDMAQVEVTQAPVKMKPKEMSLEDLLSNFADSFEEEEEEEKSRKGSDQDRNHFDLDQISFDGEDGGSPSSTVESQDQQESEMQEVKEEQMDETEVQPQEFDWEMEESSEKDTAQPDGKETAQQQDQMRRNENSEEEEEELEEVTEDKKTPGVDEELTPGVDEELEEEDTLDVRDEKEKEENEEVDEGVGAIPSLDDLDMDAMLKKADQGKRAEPRLSPRDETQSSKHQSPKYEDLDDEQLEEFATRLLGSGNDARQRPVGAKGNQKEDQSSEYRQSVVDPEDDDEFDEFDEEEEEGEDKVSLRHKYHKQLQQARSKRHRQETTITVHFQKVSNQVLVLVVLAGAASMSYLMVRRRREERLSKEK